MRILLVSSANPDSRTGVTAHYNRLLAHLANRVDSVQLVTPSDTPAWFRTGLGAGRRLAKWLGPNGRVQYLEFENFMAIWASVRLKGSERFDLVHAQDATAGAAAALALKVPVVTTCHFNDDPMAEYAEKFTIGPRTLRRLTSWFEFLFRQSNAFITVSDYTRRKAQSLIPKGVACAVIHNGVVFPPVAARPENNALVITNIGTIEDRKNQRLLIDAADVLCQRGFTGFQVQLLGDGPRRAEWEALVNERGLDAHVSFLGFQPNIMERLQRASLYVHTARNESWGYTITEAIAAGTPVLALATGGIPEQFDTHKPGLLPAETTATELADAILRYQSAEARQRLATEQRAYAYGRFRLDTMIDKHLALYRAVLNQDSDFNWDSAVHNHSSAVS